MKTLIYTSLAVLLCAGTPISAADYSDPTWPCIQRKVGSLSLGLMWPIAVPETEVEDAQLAHDITHLAETMVIRRITIEELRPEVEAFVARWPDQTSDNLSRVFSRTFDALNTRRARVMGGIEDFSLGQIALAEKIDATRAEMDAALAAESPDYDKVDTLEEKLDWDQVIFSDRQQSIQYLCETPQLIEKRLFAIARLLQEFTS